MKSPTENVHFSAVIFLESPDGGWATRCVPDVGWKGGVQDFVNFLPESINKPGASIMRDARFKGFWFGDSSWITDPTRRVSSRNADRVLVVIQEELIDNSQNLQYWKEGTQAVYPDLIQKSKDVRAAKSFRDHMRVVIRHPLVVAIAGGIIVGIVLALLFG